MKRGWFQIHLSTALILIFIAALLLWANLRVTVKTTVWPCGNGRSAWSSVESGFPFQPVLEFGNSYEDAELKVIGASNDDDLKAKHVAIGTSMARGFIFWELKLANALSAILLIFITGVAIERRLAKREARKP